MQDNDAQQQLKKRARRRLVGAVFFASIVALLLPLLMDHDPRPPVQDVAIHIPGQDEKPFAPALVAVPLDGVSDKPVGAVASPPEVAMNPPVVVPKPVDRLPERQIEKVPEKLPEKLPEKAPEKPKPAPEKKPEPVKAPEVSSEAKRAAAILAGQFVESAPSATSGAAASQHVILIGAFSNDGNVRNLQKKLGELGIKTYTEALNSPQGNKTRVRAGPFANRAAAEKALEKMKRIGVSGVVAPRS